MKAKISHFFCLLLLSTELFSATIQINWTIENSKSLLNQSITSLSAGTALDGDGTLLELGFYTGATQSNPFLGSWTVLATSSMGDTGVNQDGRFSVSTTLVDGSFIAPAPGTPLSIRYYNGLTAATSTHFNAVSDTTGAWNWVSPATVPPTLNLEITKLNSVFQSGDIGAFRTTITTGVPEPAMPSLLVLSGSLWCIKRRRSKPVG